ncbi:MAG: class I SAM-dependent methyltransferase [Frankiaceae bacterium]|nr:class I SAM-dependent methyltransferase [Frankiaceae bacterium]
MIEEEPTHRARAGGLWDEIGRLQFEFLIGQGLKPHHQFLDVGCGPLRGGVHFVRFLDVGNYCGVDANQEMLAAGRAELALASVDDRSPDLRCDATFELGSFERLFDFGLAQSVFTHLPLNSIMRCLVAVSRVLVPGGRFYATFFENPYGRLHLAPVLQPRTDGQPQQTYPDRDPYHYDARVFAWACEGTDLEVTVLGDWAHPRNQKMLLFTKEDA